MIQQDQTAEAELPTLEEVRVLFQEWRDSRPKGTETVPDYIWSQVAQLIGRYPQSEISKRLGLKKLQIKSSLRFKLSSPSTKLSLQKTLENTFIKVAMPQESFISKQLPLTPERSLFISEFDDPRPQRESNHDTALPQSKPHNHPSRQVELVHPNGIVLRITSMTDHQLTNFVSTFMEAA